MILRAHFEVPPPIIASNKHTKGTIRAFRARLTPTSARGCPFPGSLALVRIRRPLNSVFRNIESLRTSTITDVKVLGLMWRAVWLCSLKFHAITVLSPMLKKSVNCSIRRRVCCLLGARNWIEVRHNDCSNQISRRNKMQ